jgi:hypothetical protein
MADRPICVGIKTTGDRCDKRAVIGQTRCRTHLNTVRNNGPNTTAVNELVYTHRRILREINNRWHAIIEIEQDHNRQIHLHEDFEHEYRMTQVQQRHEVDLLHRAHEEQIRQTGIDPDAEVRERRRQELLERNRQRDERIQHIRMINDEQAQRLRNRLLEVRQQEHLDEDNRPAARPGVQHRGELAEFVRDGQNVHTIRTVNATKEMVAIILTVPVPTEYKWNGQECSKTPGEIIMMCRLSLKAAWQMTAKYCQDESIYELGRGIYGKVLDGVWQYILSSPDKADLCRCLKQEMEDNIGMCAQGNLSRLCNILAGYMEGIGSQESVADILGRLMPKLMEIEDVSTRLRESFRILKENNVPISQWKSWVDPLLMDQDEPMTVGFIRNAQDEVVGFLAVGV